MSKKSKEMEFNDFEKNIKNHDVVDEMKLSFLDYAMSVIVARALPDARDGQKPVHRRILYAMNELEMTHGRPHKKSAHIVGTVLAKYHPHGDSSVYEAMVRMAQDFSMRYPLIDGQGNFGSIDGDGAAAMRYTESRMSKITNELLFDIKKDTVDFIPNYDGSEIEPIVLPTKIPTLLMNGSTGIAVGMATSIPPHNLVEIMDALITLVKNNETSIEELCEIVPGPDFPTGATIVGDDGIKEAYKTGNGSLKIKSKVEIEKYEKDNFKLIISEIPYMINKTKLIERIAYLVKEKAIESIRDLRDESSRKLIRIVIELKKGFIPEVELNKLYKMTQLQSTFSINMLALVNNEPKVLNLKEILQIFLSHSDQILVKKTKYDLKRYTARVHILDGLLIALKNIDVIINLIKKSKQTIDATKSLINKFKFTEKQAKSILEMRLQRLTGLEQQKIIEEKKELDVLIEEAKEIIKSKDKRNELICKDLERIKKAYGDKRKTHIIGGSIKTIKEEDLIEKKDVVITLSDRNYIKRIPLSTYSSQNRGGVGIIGMKTYDKDFVKELIVANTHTDLLFFSNKGKIYRTRTHKIPEFGRQAKGLPIVNLLEGMEKGEIINSLLSIKKYDENKYIVFVTKKGIIKKTSITQYKKINKKGKIAITLRKDDELVGVKQINPTDFILIGSTQGKVVLFKSTDIRAMGRTAHGVKGMTVPKTDLVIGFAIAMNLDQKILSISETGFGKITALENYRLTKRGGKGVISLNIKKAGKMTAIKVVYEGQEIILTTNKGTILRTKLEQISETSRNAKGVIIKRVNKNEKIVSIGVIDKKTQDIIDTVELNVKNYEKK